MKNYFSNEKECVVKKELFFLDLLQRKDEYFFEIEIGIFKKQNKKISTGKKKKKKSFFC